MNVEKIGSYILKLRKEKKLTQEELASKVFVTNKAVSRWETGKGLPEIETLYLLSKELGVSVNDILNCGTKSTTEVKKYYDKKKLKNILFDVLFFIIMTITPIIYMMSLVRLSGSYLIGTSNISSIDINTIKDAVSFSNSSMIMFIIYWIIMLVSYVFYKMKNKKIIIALLAVSLLFTIGLIPDSIQLFNIGSLIYNIDFILFLVTDIIIFIQLLIIRKDN